MSETDLSRSIRRALTALGFWCIRVQSGTLPVQYGARVHYVHCAEPGTPDLILPALGWMEVKTTDGKLEASQLAWHRRAADEGIRVETVRSVSAAVSTATRWRDLDNAAKLSGLR